VPIASKDRRAILTTIDQLIEAPNWTPDGQSLIYNSKGRLYRVPSSGGPAEVIETGFATKCNNDHGVSPNGKLIVLSDQSQDDKKSRIYTVAATGGVPQLLTKAAPSYWHGWSPDGKTIAYCAQRDGEFDIYTMPAAGGEETRLTTTKGLDDGPDYSPDGKFIYFNSDRTGQMQIWRMKADGSAQEQVTKDETNNWFPHPSPDGKWLVFLTYEKDVTGHPENKDVTLHLLDLTDEAKPAITLAKLFGGQGTINVPSWSPDSKKLAFVSYQLVP
jgi:Tol biopolymer transport system component